MKIVVTHRIHDPENFWAAAQESLANLNEAGIRRAIQIMPSADMKQATCVWEAESIDILAKFMRRIVGEWSTEFYMELNEENAMGMPV